MNDLVSQVTHNIITAILTYFKYFLDCLQSCLTGARNDKDTKSAKNTFTGDVVNNNIFAKATAV